MEHYGVAVGMALLAVVTAVAVLLGARAAASVARFRSGHHERFTGHGSR